MPETRSAADDRSALALMLLPGVLVVLLGYDAGGFFPASTGAVAVVLALGLVLRTLLAERPFEGLGAAVVVPAGALAALAGWALVSSAWSDAPARAVFEFDRVLAYCLAMLLVGSVGRTPQRLRWLVRGLAAGIVVVCVGGLLTRILPEVFPVALDVSPHRLSYPVSYWNALGLLASVGLVLCFHLSADRREPLGVNVAAAAALPALATALYFTFSRAAIGLGLIVLLVYVVLARPRGLAGAMLAALPAVPVLLTAYGAELLAGRRPTTSAAVEQGSRVALALAICVAVAALVRLAASALDSRVERARLPRLSPGRAASAIVAGAVVVVVVAVAAGLPGTLERQYDRFVEGDTIGQARDDSRMRLTDASSNGRIEIWRAALDAFRERPLEGQGAGTFAVEWTQRRLEPEQVLDAHSLWVEMLAELGVVGTALLALAVIALLVGGLLRIRGEGRSVQAAAWAALLLWTLHSALDWDWELPAVTLPLLALGAAAAAETAGAPSRSPSSPLRAALGLGLLVLAVTPALAAISDVNLRQARQAFERGDCAKTIDNALDSLDALGSRAEPYELLAYCNSRRGDNGLALQMMQRAIARDPGNWQFVYGLALVRGAAGRDPRPQARRALRLNRFDELAEDAVEDLGNNPATWRRRAREARLPFN